MNILITIGNSANFDFTHSKKVDKTFAGICFPAYVLMRIVKAYPEHTFYYIGSNNLDNIENKPANIINIDNECRKAFKKRTYDNIPYISVAKYIETLNIKFDLGFVFYTQKSAIVQYEYGFLTLNGTERQLLISEKNLSYVYYPFIYFDIPYYMIKDDPRELNQIPADMKLPIATISQEEGIEKVKMFNKICNEYDKHPSNKVIKNIKVDYVDLPKLWFATKVKKDWRKIKKTNKFIITLNGTPSRFNDLRKWIFNYDKSVKVYGRWDTPKTLVNSIHKYSLENNFINKGILEMEDLMFKTKYTLVVPVKSTYPAFVTLKPWTMIYYGIIPFWDKNHYDVQNHLSEFPDYLKVDSPEQLYERINKLENNKQLYNTILEKLWNLLKDEYFNEDYTNTIFDKYLK